MADVVDKETRSRMMSGILGHNTKPELVIRHLLHSHGFRYRLHVRELPGKPDIVLPRHHAVIFINAASGTAMIVISSSGQCQMSTFGDAK